MAATSPIKRIYIRALAIAASMLVACFVAIAAFSTVFATQAQAASPEYKYTVNIYSGAQGTFNGQEVLTINNVVPGSRVAFNQGSVTIDSSAQGTAGLNTGSKYYIRGVKVSGRDNDTTLNTPSFVVTEDMDLVVCYGLLGENVSYTVRYVDTDNNELLPTETFYGNVGDSPVLAYRYIEGYTPQAYNLTGKLVSDPAKNVYTFTYTTTEGTGENPAENPEGAEQGQNPVTTVVAPGAGAAEEPVATVVDEEAIAGNENPLAAPEDVQDIRDEDNPLAFFGLTGEDAQFLFDNAAIIFLSGVAAAVLIALLILFILRRRRRNHELAYEAARSEAMANNGQTGGDDSGAGASGGEA